MLADHRAVCARRHLDQAGLLARYDQEVAADLVEGYLIDSLWGHAATGPTWHHLGSTLEHTEVDLNQSLRRLNVPHDDLVVLFEANDYL